MVDDEDDRRASCHVQANCIVRQAKRDCAGSDHDVFDILEWRIGEMLFDIGARFDCFHRDALDAAIARLRADEAETA